MSKLSDLVDVTGYRSRFDDLLFDDVIKLYLDLSIALFKFKLHGYQNVPSIM